MDVYACSHANGEGKQLGSDDLGPCTLLVTHGTLCSGEPLITDAESISISRGFTTCDLDRAPYYMRPTTGCASFYEAQLSISAT